ncbi:MAG: glycoside hydrolase family 9 protein [Myxococcota bacterium]|nr:glycoside hydrolase family 9 protein [Myxococcota bacterium]
MRDRSWAPGGWPMQRWGYCALAMFAFACWACGAQKDNLPTSSPSVMAVTPPDASLAAPAAMSRARVAELLRPLRLSPTTHSLIKISTFDSGRSVPWMGSFSKPADGETAVETGALCLDVANAGVSPWDAQLRHREMTIQKGHRYTIRVNVASTTPTTVLAKIAMSGPPYKSYWQQHIDLGREPKVVRGEFTMTEADDATAEFAFHAGGHGASTQVPFDVCIDDVVLEDPEYTPTADAPLSPVPNVLVNQVGYPPGLAKVAIIKSAATAPLQWDLLDRTGKIVRSGETVVHGMDASSGDRVHTADFSSFTTSGAGFALRAGGDVSHAFDIGPAVYRKLKYDALHFFYHMRSGIDIAMPYADDPKWTHAAGHPGDKSVPCAPDAHCDYTLDVSGGWYDAGDHGKYVVNGGIAVWTLMNQYERAKYLGSTVADFGDGKMNIPENHNGVPDLLDEVQWELDFLMKMQVPEGKPMAGMAHHKIHDREWTALGTRPDTDTIPRFLRPVSTAATLNLAAATAQCARLFKGVNGAFSARCLIASERAWAAAQANPAVYALSSDSVGGGAYDDDDVTDEFYWAASELYVTTQKDEYRDFLMRSPHHGAASIAPKGHEETAMTWRDVAALGSISLAVVPNGLTKEVAAARMAILKAADAYVRVDQEEGYRLGFKPDASGKYPWGSNGCVVNNALVMALAYDFSKDPKYMAAVENTMSYVLGKNPLDQSYVTGYGFRPLQNPHHRFWAHQATAGFPSPPPGVMSGGPNSNLQDPYVRAAGLRGCAPMKCFADNIEAFSANEEAINWNAPLAWVAAFLDEHSRGADRSPAKPALTR